MATWHGSPSRRFALRAALALIWVVLVGAPACESDDDGGPADAIDAAGDATGDTGGGTDTAEDVTDDAAGEVADDTGGDQDVDEEDDTGEPPATAAREVAEVSINRACVGCDEVSICGRPTISDATVLTFGASLNNETGVLFATERYEAAGRALPLDTCRFFEGAALDAVIEAPTGVQCRDGGALTADGDMTLLSEPIVLEYSSVTHNYPSIFRPETPEHAWTAGADLALEGAGGDGVSPFSLTWPAPEKLVILTPHTDEDGQVENIATDAPLAVTWSGGGDFETLVVVLHGEYCQLGPRTFVACNVTNDGDFTVPLDVLSQVTWPNAVQLFLFASHKIPIDAPELTEGAAWSVRATASLYVWWDEAAAPPQQTCDSDHMDEGFVGAPCDDDTDCGGGCCLREVGGHFAGNYCTLLGCESDAECPPDAACTVQSNPFLPIGDFCGARCESNDDCRFPEYACLDNGAGTTVCRPNLW